MLQLAVSYGKLPFAIPLSNKSVDSNNESQEVLPLSKLTDVRPLLSGLIWAPTPYRMRVNRGVTEITRQSDLAFWMFLVHVVSAKVWRTLEAITRTPR